MVRVGFAIGRRQGGGSAPGRRAVGSISRIRRAPAGVQDEAESDDFEFDEEEEEDEDDVMEEGTNDIS